jgi:hypothetical protein
VAGHGEDGSNSAGDRRWRRRRRAEKLRCARRCKWVRELRDTLAELVMQSLYPKAARRRQQ